MKQADCKLTGFRPLNLASVEPINDCADRIAFDAQLADQVFQFSLAVTSTNNQHPA
ncbi:hypothetical protein D3C84_1034960 [compost metagenome]